MVRRRVGGKGSVSPRIGPITPITMRAEYQLPWNRKSNQTACGQTIQTPMGDLNWRVVIEGILTKPQLDELRNLRTRQSQVEVVTEEFGMLNVGFDQLNITRVSDEEDMSGPDDYEGPLIQFQLQSKEDEGEGIEFFNENTRGTPQD